MNKKEIKKTYYEHIKFVEDDFLTPEFIKQSGNAVVLKYQYKQFIMYFPVNLQTAKGKTKAQLFKLFMSDFTRNYNEFLLQALEDKERD